MEHGRTIERDLSFEQAVPEVKEASRRTVRHADRDRRAGDAAGEAWQDMEPYVILEPATLSSPTRAPSKSRFVPFVRDHASRAQLSMAALIQVEGQSPALGILGHLVHTSTLTGPWG